LRQFLKGVAVGVAGTLLVVGSLGYAAALSQRIDVTFLPLRYMFDGEERVPPEQLRGFVYNNSTYVPFRWLTESLGKSVQWDGSTYTIRVSTPGQTGAVQTPAQPEPQPNQPAAGPVQVTQPVFVNGAAWSTQLAPIRHDGRLFFVLSDLNQMLGHTVGKEVRPDRTLLITQGDARLSLTTDAVTLNGRTIATPGYLIWNDRTFLPIRPLAESLGFTVSERADGIYLAGLKPQNRADVWRVIFEFAGGERYLVNGMGDFYTDPGQKLFYVNFWFLGELLAILNDKYDVSSVILPGGVLGQLNTHGHRFYEEQVRYVDMSDINSRSYRIHTVSNPANGKSLTYSDLGTSWQGNGAQWVGPHTWEEAMAALGLNVTYSYDPATGLLLVRTGSPFKAR
jgi:hypothetical protein